MPFRCSLPLAKLPLRLLDARRSLCMHATSSQATCTDAVRQRGPDYTFSPAAPASASHRWTAMTTSPIPLMLRSPPPQSVRTPQQPSPQYLPPPAYGPDTRPYDHDAMPSDARGKVRHPECSPMPANPAGSLDHHGTSSGCASTSLTLRGHLNTLRAKDLAAESSTFC
jgi:hypothetical protein